MSAINGNNLTLGVKMRDRLIKAKNTMLILRQR